MADHVDVPTTVWARLLTFEPAVVKGVISLLVALGLIWGLDFAGVGEQLQQTTDILGSLVLLIGPLWIRSSVTPSSLVVAKVNKEGDVVAADGSAIDNGALVDVLAAN